MMDKELKKVLREKKRRDELQIFEKMIISDSEEEFLGSSFSKEGEK